MKTEFITSGVLPKPVSTDAQMLFGLDKDQWLKTITAGQILKGKILKVYSDGKYGVDFGGRERVVDSAIPLSVGSKLTGRVIVVSDESVSMKIVTSKEENINLSEKVQPKTVSTKTPLEIEIEQFRIDLSRQEKLTIIEASRHSENSVVTMHVGLYLAKLGLPISTEFIRIMTDRVLNDRQTFKDNLLKNVPLLFTTDHAMIDSQHLNYTQSYENLKQFLEREFNAPENSNSSVSDNSNNTTGNPITIESFDSKLDNQGKQQSEEEQMAKMMADILNISTEGASKHTLQTLPIIIDGRLIEFDIAFFDQSKSKNNEMALRSRCIRFALDTDYGRLSLVAQVVNNRLNISFASESHLLIDNLLTHQDSLDETLSDQGWIVDSIKYDLSNPENTAAYSVIQHVLQQGSLEISA